MEIGTVGGFLEIHFYFLKKGTFWEKIEHCVAWALVIKSVRSINSRCFSHACQLFASNFNAPVCLKGAGPSPHMFSRALNPLNLFSSYYLNFI